MQFLHLFRSPPPPMYSHNSCMSHVHGMHSGPPHPTGGQLTLTLAHAPSFQTRGAINNNHYF